MAEQSMEKQLGNGGLTLQNTPPHQDQKLDEISQDPGKDLQKTSMRIVDQAIENPFNSPTLAENGGLENTPPFQDQKLDENPQDSGKDLRKTCTPDRLKVPKAFRYPERYRSPTDSMMSPVTKGILARNRKAGGSLLPPSINQTKIHELRAQDVGLSQN